jgi:hypothetical protein
MRRALLMIVLLIVVGVLAWEFIPLAVTVWDGSFDLTVRVSSTAGPLDAVSCQACGRREDADYVLEHLLPPETRRWSAVADPFDGQPLTVVVPVSGRDSPSGRELRRSQFRYLVVIGQWQDGRRMGKLVEIPDGRVFREIDVSLP